MKPTVEAVISFVGTIAVGQSTVGEPSRFLISSASWKLRKAQGRIVGSSSIEIRHRSVNHRRCSVRIVGTGSGVRLLRISTRQTVTVT